MAEKLKSLLLDRTLWRLASRAGSLALALFLVRLFSASWWSLLLYVFSCTSLYKNFIRERKFLSVHFLALNGLAIAVMFISPYSFSSIAAILLVFAILIFFLISLSQFSIKREPLVYRFTENCVVLTLFITVFSLPQIFFDFSYLAYPFLFAVLLLLSRESLLFSGIQFSRRALLYAAGLSFIILQIVFLVFFLPLGFINASALLLLLTALLKNSILTAFEGLVDNRFIVKEVSIGVLITLLIFILSTWEL